MGINKVELTNEDGTKNTLVDLTGDTVTPEALMEGHTAHNAAGEQITGTARAGGTEPVQSDWNVNDPADPAYIKNRICYKTGRKVAETVLPQTTAEFSENGDYMECAVEMTGEPLTVIWDGVAYPDAYHTFEGNEYLGNLGIGGGPDTGEPFFYHPLESFWITTASGTTHTIEITKEVDEVVPMPEEYFPPEIKTKISNMVGSKYTGGGEIFNHPNNKAPGPFAHAEGIETTAEGGYSHAEGSNNTTNGQSAHAEGQQNVASGEYSHVEGILNSASGEASHAEGEYTIASGRYSHAEGYVTTAAGENQHVQGKYNIPDPNSKYADIVGNGEGNANRSNAYTLDWEGNGWYQRMVGVGKNGSRPAAALGPTGVVITSSTPGSVKQFMITVDDTGAITATEI